MDRLRTRLDQGPCLIADGAMGTLLIERGLEPGMCPEQINLERPEVPAEIAGMYAQAGAQIVQTNTFGASPLKLDHWGLARQTEAINRAAVRAARSAVAADVYVAASCGPSGKLLEPYGDTSPEDVYAAFKRQFEALMEEGVDLVFIETMSDLAEAQLALRAAREVCGPVPVAVTLTFERTPFGFRTIMGTGIEEVVKALSADGADILGSNCGLGCEAMVEVAREMRQHTDKPLLMQPNAGIPHLQGNFAIYPESPKWMAARARDFLASGVNILGGCCGTTPAHIQLLRRTMDELTGTRPAR